ncbi:class I SAM-dependent methyltransferase [Methanomicrobium antiquum]|uniref:Class I SAM-dependent methyltransferase n=1 Tax=Methanomicrobium antiquum TaxID=487686 RepID=A0AAF0FVP5_9EURY|nr:class I SAM-dependent methyltransferase [Methanomicrobium antiquum]WFN36785.1 class I SAM-dependent methyltransferase [Methanomicrobium antiquum]
MELKRYLPQADGGVVLEIGSSSGYLLRDIKKTFPDLFIIGSDCISEPLEKIAKNYPEIPLIQFDLVNCPLPDNCVDVIIALNVLEHIEDDVAALEQIYRILKPGGHAIIEVPANPDLYDFYDEQLKHFRRYNLLDLKEKVNKIGLDPVRSSHLGFFVYPGFKFAKRRNIKKMQHLSDNECKEKIKQEMHFGGNIMNAFLYALIKFELLLGKNMRYPFGIRCLLVLSK